MSKPPIPDNELDRLQALLSKEILDTPTEDAFDRIVKLAADICGVKYSAISLIDSERQWFKAKHGFDLDSTTREVSFCAHVVAENKTIEVVNANTDKRFRDNPRVTGDPFLKFYVGIPLIDEKGFALGALCVFDSQQKALEDFQRSALEVLAKKVMTLIQQKRG